MHTFGRWGLHGRIGLGGEAEVWLATTRTPPGEGRPVALKRLLPGRLEDREARAALEEEGRILSRLSHPGVVRLYEAGAVAGHPYLALEHVHGADLRTILERFRRQQRFPPLAFTLNLVADLAGALDHVHRAADDDRRPLGLVHRDVSPPNVLLSFDGRVKLVDFGIARGADAPEPTGEQRVKGKVGYLSPEQARGQPATARSDVYQVGTLFYEALTLAHPFLGGTHEETVARIVAGRTTRPRTLRAAIPPRVEDCVRDALRPRPDDRFPSARVLRAAAEHALGALDLPRGVAPLRAQMALLFPDAAPLRLHELEGPRGGREAGSWRRPAASAPVSRPRGPRPPPTDPTGVTPR